VQKTQKTNNWHVYLLWNTRTRRTYIGATTNPDRRLRQHRGELVGGAKSTKREQKYWVRICYLSGFQDRREAYRWEKLLKMRAIGLQDRRDAFCEVGRGQCPKHPKKPHLKQYTVPPGLSLNFELKFFDDNADKQV
jgi:predicted GIY-YIG superfamily endonuclease